MHSDMCIQETLRLFPTVPIIGRVPSKPIKLSNNVEVPANVMITFGMRQIQIQEKYYGPTANIYDPYRFLEENMKDVPAAAYIPFSYGPRNCIGEREKTVFHSLMYKHIKRNSHFHSFFAGYHYAKASVKCFTAHLVRNFRITTSYTHIDQLQLVQNVSFGLIDKHMIKLEARSS